MLNNMYCFYFICAWKPVKKLSYSCFFVVWIGWLLDLYGRSLKPWQNKKDQTFVGMHRFLNPFFLNFNQLPAKDFWAFGVALEPPQKPREKDSLYLKSLYCRLQKEDSKHRASQQMFGPSYIDRALPNCK